jgi:CRP-like cAMP-binding protein
LLAALPADAQARLLPHLGLVDLRPGHTLLQHGCSSVRSFFPLAGLVSLTQELAAGTNVLVALVGSDGMLGLPLKIGDAVMYSRAVVQCPGFGLALGRERLMQEWSRGGSFRRILSRYARFLQAQVAQLETCRRDHSIEQQLCRLLLVSQEHLAGPEPGLTLEAVVRMLGGEPESVTQAVRQLHDAGVIRLRLDGVLAVADASALHGRACGCNRRLSQGQVKNDVPGDNGHRGGRPAPWASNALPAFSAPVPDAAAPP